jgi:hypothetical protein
MKIPKFKVQMKVILMIITTIIAVFLIRLLLIGGLAKLLSFDSQRTEVYKDTDITHYQWYIGKNMLINGEWMKVFFQKVLQITWMYWIIKWFTIIRGTHSI